MVSAESLDPKTGQSKSGIIQLLKAMWAYKTTTYPQFATQPFLKAFSKRDTKVVRKIRLDGENLECRHR